MSKCDIDYKSGPARKTCQLITDGPCSTNFDHGAINRIMSVNNIIGIKSIYIVNSINNINISNNINT